MISCCIAVGRGRDNRGGVTTEQFGQAILGGHVVTPQQFPVAVGKRREVNEIAEVGEQPREHAGHRHAQDRLVGVAPPEPANVIAERIGRRAAEIEFA